MACVVALMVAAVVSAVPAGAAPPEPASATNIAGQVGLAQVSKSWSANVGDYDNDGDPDVMYVPHNSYAARLYRNDGGSFTEVMAGTFKKQDRHDCAWGDANVDGFLDLYCSLGASSGTATNPKELWIRQPGGTFVNRATQWGVADPYGRGRAVTFIDVNHDPYPDLFIGNEYPRQDGVPVPNHLFINQGGTSFKAVPNYGVDEEVGGMCVQAADVNRDGWDDLLVCGQTGLHLYRNDGGTRFVEVSGAWGVGGLTNGLHNARLVELTGDGKLDLAIVTQTSLRVLPQGANEFGPVSFQLPLTAGQWVAAGDFQDDGARDLYVVQRCRNGVNEPDHLLLGDGTGTSFSKVPLPQATSGCGDAAERIDIDQDGDDEFIVLNGLGRTVEGPLQVISSGPATGPPPSPCTITGTAGADTLVGTPGDDVICGFGGKDRLEGRGGSDRLLGGEGVDTLLGGDGHDELDGGNGNDVLEGGNGNDQLVGGAGRDTVRFSGLTVAVTVDLVAGTATGQGADSIQGAEAVQGSPAGDEITGSSSAETMNGLGGKDRVTGGGGPDTIIGGGGADTLLGVDGVNGNDTLDGKAGIDSCSADPGDTIVACP
jgi:FG-GAP-like repeat/RTX calcium-binding nonapeptide repeat (4 copies)